MYRLKQLIKTYNGKQVLAIDHMHIPEQTICCVSGPNGSGKTTLLEILAGIVQPSSGEALFRGNPISESAKGKIIMVLQNPVMFNTTVYGNLAFALKINGIPRKERDQLITSTLTLLEIDHLEKRNANRLSGGEKQRVAIARALVLDPDVLIMDEPTAGLDIPARNSLIDIIKRIHARKKIGVIVASHDKEFLLSIAGTAFTLIQGKHAPISVDNLFTGTVIDESTIGLPSGVQIYVSTHRTGKVNVVIPPENIVLSAEPIESSMRNRFQGHVVRLEKNGDYVKVHVDIGVELCSVITPQSIRKMRITIGDPLWVEFKATSVKIY